MRIVFLNAWGGQVWPALSAWVCLVGADILCLREVTRAPVPSPDWLVYADPERRLDQRAYLFADVSGLLPGRQALFAAAMRGTLQDGAGRAFASEHGNAVWLAPGLAVTAQVQCFVHGQFRPDGWGAPPAPRTMQVLRIWVPAFGRHVVAAIFTDCGIPRARAIPRRATRNARRSSGRSTGSASRATLSSWAVT